MVRLRITTMTLSTRGARALASFDERLLGSERGSDEPGWVTIGERAGGHRLGFLHDDHDRAPVRRRPTFQPQADVRVVLDSEGHPFCLFRWPDMPAAG